MELLIVIAIIGILTSILMPELAKVRQKGFQTVCLNNCRQATLAVIMYADENNMALSYLVGVKLYPIALVQ